MRITFYGGTQGVTGSNYLVETAHGERFMVDCGMFQGSKTEEAKNHEPLPYDPSQIDFAILTHAHIDHSGRIPKLVKDGFNAPIYMTPATADLVEIMLADSASIQESDAEWENRKRERAGGEPVVPLYTQDEVDRTIPLIQTKYYGEIFEATPHLRIRFTDAGHILGSAITEVWADEPEGTTKVVFSGDLGMQGHALISDPQSVDSADAVLMETTYGNTTHGNYQDSLTDLMQIIEKVTGQGGTVVIPSFAIGRTQELIYEMNKYYEYNDVPEEKRVPIYLDSPLAKRATAVFMKNTDIMNEEAKELIRKGDNIFLFPNLTYTETVEDSKALNMDKRPKVIISASGMATGGRVRHHLKHTIWDPKNAVIFVGYQAEGTLGRILLDGQVDQVKIMGESIQVRAQMYDMEGFSAHADQPTLLNWFDRFETKPEEVILVHGELREMEPFATLLKAKYNVNIDMPAYADQIDIKPGQTPSLLENPQRRESVQREVLAKQIQEVELLLHAYEGREMKLVDKEMTLEEMEELQTTLNELRSHLMRLNMQLGS